MLLSLVFLVGCGGSGDRSPFAGRFSGTGLYGPASFACQSDGVGVVTVPSGQYIVSVDPSGRFTGNSYGQGKADEAEGMMSLAGNDLLMTLDLKYGPDDQLRLSRS